MYLMIFAGKMELQFDGEGDEAWNCYCCCGVMMDRFGFVWFVRKRVGVSARRRRRACVGRKMGGLGGGKILD